MKTHRMEAALLLAIAAAGCSSPDRGSDRDPCPAASGSAVITIRTSICPVIANVTLSSSSPAVGQPVDLTASVTDADSSNLVFSWTVASGIIANRGVAITTFTCAAPGPVAIVLTVSDGTCVDQLTTDVVCRP